MRQFIFLLFFIIYTYTLSAQNWGVYAGVHTHYGEFNGDDYGFFGGKVAYISPIGFSIGVGGYGFAALDKLGFKNTNASGVSLAGGYGGLHLEPIMFFQDRIQISIPVFAGLGRVGEQLEELDYNFDFERDTEDWQSMYVLEPGVNLTLALARFIQLDIGARYRFTNQIEIDNQFNDRLNGWSGGLEFKFGLFPKRTRSITRRTVTYSY